MYRRLLAAVMLIAGIHGLEITSLRKLPINNLEQWKIAQEQVKLKANKSYSLTIMENPTNFYHFVRHGKGSIDSYRIFTGEIRFVEIINVSHVATPQLAFKDEGSIRSHEHGNCSCSSSRPSGSLCIDLVKEEFTYQGPHKFNDKHELKKN